MKFKLHIVLLSGLLTGCGAGIEDYTTPVLGAANTDPRSKIAGQYLLDDSSNGVKCQTDISYSEKGKWSQSSKQRKKSGTFSVVTTEEELDTLVKVTDADNGLADCKGNTTAETGEIDILFFEIADDGDLSFYDQPEKDSVPILVLDKQVEEPEASQQLALQSQPTSNSTTTFTAEQSTPTDGAETVASGEEAITVAEALEARHEAAVVDQESSEQVVQELTRTSEIADQELAEASNRLAAANANLEAMSSAPAETVNPDDSNALLEAYVLERELTTTVDEEKALAAAQAARDVDAPRLIAVQDTADQLELAEANGQEEVIHAGSDVTTSEPADTLAQQQAYEQEQQLAAELEQQKKIEADLAAEQLAAANLKAEQEAADTQAAANDIQDWTNAERTAKSRTLEVLLCQQCNIGQVKLKMPAKPAGEKIDGFRVYYGDATQTSTLLDTGSSPTSALTQFNFTDLATSKNANVCFSTTTYNPSVESFKSAPMCILTLTAAS